MTNKIFKNTLRVTLSVVIMLMVAAITIVVASAARTQDFALTVGESQVMRFQYPQELTVKGSSSNATAELTQNGSSCSLKVTGTQVGSASFVLYDTEAQGDVMKINVVVKAPKVDTQTAEATVIKNAVTPFKFTYNGELSVSSDNSNVSYQIQRNGSAYTVNITGKSKGRSVLSFKDKYGSVVLRLNVTVEAPEEKVQTLEMMVGDVKELEFNYSGDGLSQNTTGNISAKLSKVSSATYKVIIEGTRSGSGAVVVSDKNGNPILRVTVQVAKFEQSLTFSKGSKIHFDSTTFKQTELTSDKPGAYISPKNGTVYDVYFTEAGTYVLTYTSSSGKKMYYQFLINEVLEVNSGDTLQYKFSTKASCRLVGYNANIKTRLINVGGQYVISFTPSNEAKQTYSLVDTVTGKEIMKLEVRAYLPSGNLTVETGVYEVSKLSGYDVRSSNSSIAKVLGNGEYEFLRSGSCKLLCYNGDGLLAYVANVTVR